MLPRTRSRHRQLLRGRFIPRPFASATLSQNYCRKNVADNQIVEVPFEEYVARVLPAEVPPSWDMEALKAQAVAVRTYAWNKIWQNRKQPQSLRHQRLDQQPGDVRLPDCPDRSGRRRKPPA